MGAAQIVAGGAAFVAVVFWAVQQATTGLTGDQMAGEAPVPGFINDVAQVTDVGWLPSHSWYDFTSGCAAGHNGTQPTDIRRPARLTDFPGFDPGTWTPQRYLQSYADSDVQLQVKMSNNPTFFLGCCQLALVPVRDCFAHMLRLEASEATGGGSDDAQFGNLPRYFYQSSGVDVLGGAHEVLEHALASQLHAPAACGPFDQRALAAGETKAHVWVGSKGVRTPAHYDEMHNVFFQLHGRKRIRLASPELWRRAGTYPKFHHQHRNIRKLSVFRSQEPSAGPPGAAEPGGARGGGGASGGSSGGFSGGTGSDGNRARDFGVVEVEMRPGDALFIPAFWFHEVDTLSQASVSLNIWSPAPEVAALDGLWNVALPYTQDIVAAPERIVPLTAALALHILRASEPSVAATLATLREFYESRYAPIPDDLLDERQAIHPKSAEYRRHAQYLDMVREQSPPFVALGSSDGGDGDGPVLAQLCGRAETAQFADTTFGCRHSDCAAGLQRGDQVRTAAAEVATILADAVAAGHPRKPGQVASAGAGAGAGVGSPATNDAGSGGGGVGGGIVTITVLNFVEDVVAQTAGFDHVGEFLERCVLALPLAEVEALLHAEPPAPPPL